MRDSDFKRIDIEKLSQIPSIGGTHRLVKNCWWVVDKDGKGLKFGKASYQYNMNKNVNSGMIEKEIEGYPGVGQVFIENAWL